VLYRQTPVKTTTDTVGLERVGDEVDALFLFWEAAFLPLNWPDRLQLLEQIDEELHRGWRHAPTSEAISQALTERLIDRFDRPAIQCRDQADVYGNSRRPSDREAASLWRKQGDRSTSVTVDSTKGVYAPSDGPLET
jgi:hypothetical protein